MKLRTLLIILILVAAFFLRFYKLNEVPAGIHQDEESHGYNAYSLLKTGKDRYGQSFPILFRSFGSYQPPVYTYLATIPVGIFGNTIASARSVSVITGVILVLVTYFLALELFKSEYRREIALLSALVVAISPWSIYFSRLVAEGNLGVTFFVLSILLFLLSLKKPWVFIVATCVLALSTHAYYSERVISMVFLPTFIYLFRDYFWRTHKKFLLLGLGLFSIIMLPHVFILTTGALTKRLEQVGYLNSTSSYFGEFIKRYLVYFSPRNLFFDLGAGLGRMPPSLGVFYTLFIIPFLMGIRELKSVIKPNLFTTFMSLILITPISAALTGDSYYPLRSLDLIWIFAIIISVGMFKLLKYLPKTLGLVFISFIILHSLASFYLSYFILFKYEMAKDYGNPFISLLSRLDAYKEKKIVVDSTRYPGAGLRMAYLIKYDPLKLQEQLKAQLKTPYYTSNVALHEDYRIDNIQFKPIDWREIECDDNVVLVGDIASASDGQQKEHNLKVEFDVKDISGYDGLVVYKVVPSKKCEERAR